MRPSNDELWIAFWAGFKQALCDAFWTAVWLASMAIFATAFYLWSQS